MPLSCGETCKMASRLHYDICKYACSFNSELGRSPDGIRLEIFNEGMKIYRTDFDIFGVDGNFRF